MLNCPLINVGVSVSLRQTSLLCLLLYFRVNQEILDAVGLEPALFNDPSVIPQLAEARLQHWFLAQDVTQTLLESDCSLLAYG